jgi:hypothetical protein
MVIYLATGMNKFEQRGISLTELSDTVCPGEQLTLICETNDTGIEILQWSVNLPSGDKTLMRRSIPIEGDDPPRQFTYENYYDDVVFNFSRTSDKNIYPFITKLSISEVNIGINGTEINCSKIDLSDQHTTIIHIMDYGRHNHYILFGISAIKGD